MSASVSQASVGARMPVVFIHDAAIDEYISVMLLSVMPGIDLLGIILVNADCLAEAAMNASSKLQQFLGTDTPIALSHARGWNAFPWEYRGDCVSFGKIASLRPYDPRVATPPPDGEALLVVLLERAIRDKTPLTLLMTGPLTPLIKVLGQHPALQSGVGKIVWMGGAIHVPGNLDPTTVNPTVANTHAEWNAFWDPFAVEEAYRLFEGIHQFPLDISNAAPVTAAFLEALQAQGKQFTYSQLAFEAYSLVTNEPFYRLWDVTAACWLARPDLYTAATPMPLEIVPWGFEQGWIRASDGTKKCHSQDVFLSFVNQAGFYDYVLGLLATSGKAEQK